MPIESGLSRLERRLDDLIDEGGCGLSFYSSIKDVQVRAVRSHQVFAQIAAVEQHLEALDDHAEQLCTLLGPHGQPMPKTDEELATYRRVTGHITDGLRAAASGLDALAGLVILLLGLPREPKRADSRELLRFPALPSVPSLQRRRLESFSEAFDAAVADAGPPGWLAWSVQARNTLVHRGSLMSLWLPASGAAFFFVRSRAPVHELIRFRPHLRSDFDRTEAESVLSGDALTDVVMAESADRTLRGLRVALGVVIETTADELLKAIGEAQEFVWPEEKWVLVERSPREREAGAFGGFARDAVLPTIDEGRINATEARRREMVLAARAAEPRARP